MEKIIKSALKEEAKIRKMSDYKARQQIKTTRIVNAETGELITESYSNVVHQNGSGFVISYTEKMLDFVKKCDCASVLRVFWLIAHNQSYGVNGIYGYRCSKKHIWEVLHMNRKTLYDALVYLRENFLVVENRFDGQSEFMVNPDYITIGTDKAARKREWSLRWEMYWKLNSK